MVWEGGDAGPGCLEEECGGGGEEEEIADLVLSVKDMICVVC